MIAQQCERVLEMHQAETGEELELEELSEEEDADLIEDNKVKMQVMMVTSPLLVSSQNLLQLQQRYRQSQVD